MTLYELNQAGYSSLPDMTYADILNNIKEISKYLDKHPSKYYALLNNDLRYYTLFAIVSNPSDLLPEIISIVTSLGKIKSIEATDSMVEFWIEYKDECHMFAFFDYDNGVVEI